MAIVACLGRGSYKIVNRLLEDLVSLGLAIKVYDGTFRLNHKPAYYYLSKQGTITIRKLLGANKYVVHALLPQ